MQLCNARGSEGLLKTKPYGAASILALPLRLAQLFVHG